MVFKVASSSTSSANESFSAVGNKEFLIISFEDQVCLNSIAGWEPVFSDESGLNHNVAPPVLPVQKTPLPSVQSKSSKADDEQCDIINGDHVGTVKRKIIIDLVSEERPPINAGHEGRISTKKHRSSFRKGMMLDQINLSKRPRSLPDFRNCHVAEEEHSIDNVIPNNGKEAAEKEDHRLKSLVSVSSRNLQKDSPVSRSLNSLSDIHNNTTSFRSKQTVRTNAIIDLRKKSTQLCSPSPDSLSVEKVHSKQSTASQKKSCVRRLNLDDSIVLQNSGSVGGNGQQALAQKETASAGSGEEPDSRKVPADLAAEKQQLGIFSKTGKNNSKKPIPRVKANLAPQVIFNRTRKVPGSPNNLPGSSQQYRLGPETQHALMSNFEEDSFCVSEKSKGDHPKTSLKSLQTVRETPRNTQKDNCIEISIDVDNPNISEELFPTGIQHTEPGDNLETEKSTQQNEVQESQRTESECCHFENLGGVVSAMHKGLDVRPEGLKFTAPQIKSMCEVLSRLYNL